MTWVAAAVVVFGVAYLAWGFAAIRIGRIRVWYYQGLISPHERDRLARRTWWTAFTVAGLFALLGVFLAVQAAS